MQKYIASFIALVMLSLGVSTPAFAQNAVDYSSLTSAVNFSGALTALLAVAAIIAGVYVALKGIRFVMGMLRAG